MGCRGRGMMVSEKKASVLLFKDAIGGFGEDGRKQHHTPASRLVGGRPRCHYLQAGVEGTSLLEGES